MSSSQRALVINNRSCLSAALSRKVAAHKVIRKAGNVESETARRREDWQLQRQSQPCYVTCPVRPSTCHPQPCAPNACCCYLGLLLPRTLAAVGPDPPLLLGSIHTRWGVQIGWLWSHGHFPVARVPGKAGVWPSQLLGRGWLSFPSGLMGWGVPQTEGEWSTRPCQP